MISIEDKIMEVIEAEGEGFIFFPNDFIDFGESKSIGKALERLTEKDLILRIVYAFQVHFFFLLVFLIQCH